MDKVHELIEATYRKEEPCFNTEDGEERCYGSCSAETSRQAMDNAEKLIVEIGSLPRQAYPARNGAIYIEYMTDHSKSDGEGHMVGGEQILIGIGPGEDETEEFYQCLHWEQTTEAKTGYSKWQSSDRAEIVEKVKSVLREWGK